MKERFGYRTGVVVRVVLLAILLAVAGATILAGAAPATFRYQGY